MSRLYRTISRLQSGQKIDEERMLDILSRLSDNALRYSDDDDRLADIPARDIEDALDWAISKIEEMKEEKMADREKAMRGLKVCSGDDPDPCPLCPYYIHGSWACTTDLANDALALLREQEARVMTLDEIRSGAVEVAWIEDADKAEVIPGIWFRLSNEGGDEAVDIHIRDGFVGARLEVYGKLWRCWTARPTEEQMRETPWEGESDAE